MPDIAERYQNTVQCLDALITATPPTTDTSRVAVRERARDRMGRLRLFLDHLGRPAEQIPKVHVGGTSGKGSTTAALSAILTAAGYRTGVHTSPYLQAPSEKLQSNGTLIEAERFIHLGSFLLDELDRFPAADHITYGEAWIALVMLFLEDIRADIGVIEVGAGGRFDLTNIISPELSVITSVGIDHTNTLGDTIADIAWHKAGIIKPGRPALSAVRSPEARDQIIAEAETTGAPLTEIDHDGDIDVTRITDRSTSWREHATGMEWTIGMAGRFQARNGHIALSAARLLARQGWEIEEPALRQGLAAARIPGRTELMHGTPRTMLDGAHNAQKVAALAEDLDALLPISNHARRIVVLGALEAKHIDDMVASLLPHMDALVATSPKVLAKEGKTVAALEATAREAGFDGPIHTEPDPRAALDVALGMADAGRGDAILVTGSLYLVGNVRQHWFETDQVIAQHSSWPVHPADEAGGRASHHAAGTLNT